MDPATNNWRLKRTEYRFYAEIVTDITTQKPKCHSTLTSIQFNREYKCQCNTWVLL